MEEIGAADHLETSGLTGNENTRKHPRPQTRVFVVIFQMIPSGLRRACRDLGGTGTEIVEQVLPRVRQKEYRKRADQQHTEDQKATNDPQPSSSFWWSLVREARHPPFWVVGILWDRFR